MYQTSSCCWLVSCRKGGRTKCSVSEDNHNIHVIRSRGEREGACDTAPVLLLPPHPTVCISCQLDVFPRQ